MHIYESSCEQHNQLSELRKYIVSIFVDLGNCLVGGTFTVFRFGKIISWFGSLPIEGEGSVLS